MCMPKSMWLLQLSGSRIGAQLTEDLKEAMMSRDRSTSLNMPSSLEVNCAPHSALSFPIIACSFRQHARQKTRCIEVTPGVLWQESHLTHAPWRVLCMQVHGARFEINLTFSASLEAERPSSSRLARSFL